MEYVALVAWCFAIAAAGGLVGLVLGNLRLPLVVLLASSPAAGAGANIGISAAAAATASVTHLRHGRVNARLFGWMAPPSILGALVGGYVSGLLPEDTLLVVIAAVLGYSAIDLLRWKGAAQGLAGKRDFDRRAAVLSGAAIGLLGGVVGLILGSLRMPALLRFVGEPPATAVGTNTAVGFCVGVAGVIGHLPSEPPDWTLLALGVGASVPGALLGSRLTGRLSDVQLVRAIGIVLAVAAVAMAVQALA